VKTGLIADAVLSGLDPVADRNFGSGALLGSWNSRRARVAAGDVDSSFRIWAKASATGADFNGGGGGGGEAVTAAASVGVDWKPPDQIVFWDGSRR